MNLEPGSIDSNENQETPESDGVPPPEDFEPAPAKELGPFQRWPHLFPAFWMPITVSLTCVAFTILARNSDDDYFSASKLAVYENGEIWRLVTALFTHGDLAHIGLNLMPIIFFGWLLSAYFGAMLFFSSAITIGIFSNAITTWFYPLTTTLIGISGVVYGIIALWLILYIKFDTDNSFAKKSARVAGFILMLLFPSSYEQNVSYLAHGSGFICGIIFALVAIPLVRLRPPPPAPPSNNFRRSYYSARFRVRRASR
jgi:membrane associated rhomboid family serine protease